jgi:putative multiple sugar transport system substrate-binding protein
VQYIIDGLQSMSVFKDTRALTDKALTIATAFLTGATPETNFTINNNETDVLGWAIPVVVVEKANIKAALIDTGYYQASDFQGL